MFWGTTVTSEKPMKLESSGISNLIHLSHCSVSELQAPRCSLLVKVQGKEYHLCTLIKGSKEDQSLDLYFHVD